MSSPWLPRRPFVRNQYIQKSVHRLCNAVVPALTVSTFLLLAWPNLWVGLGSGLALFIVMLCVDPERFSLVEGVAGGEGYLGLVDENEPKC